MMLLANAEWRRYGRLELSPFRLFVIPAVGFLTVLAASFGSQPDLIIKTADIWLAFCALWGVQAACLSVVDEIADGTWDQQRLSHQSAWQLLWGKWLGSTLVSWYGVFWGIVLSLPFGMPIRHIGLLTLLMLNCQAIGVLFSFANAIRMRQVRRARVTGLRQGSFVVSLLLLVAGTFALAKDASLSRVWGDTWLAACLWLPWPVLIAYRLVRIELQERVTPAIWIGLVAFHTGFVCFPPAGTETVPGLRLLETLTLVALSYTYLTLFFERLDALRLLRLMTLRDWQARWSQMPVSWWLAAVSMGAGLTCATALVLYGGTRTEAGFSAQAIAIIVLFGLRDWLLVIFIQLSIAAHKESYGATIFGLSLLYIILPLLAGMAGIGEWGFFCGSLHPNHATIWHPLPTLALVTGLLYWRGKKVLQLQSAAFT